MPMTIVVDTREQLPFGFNPQIASTIRRGLPAGDYSIEGFESSVAVERKTLDDLVSTVIRGRRRFYKELRALKRYQYACIVVEASLSDILNHSYQSDAHPNAVIGSILAIIVEFGIPVYFCSNRQLARLFVENYLARIHRKIVQ